MSSYKGKVCVVTASSTGIGLAIARRFARDGATVVVSSRRPEAVDKAVQLIQSESPHAKAIGITCHVGEAEARKKLLVQVKEQLGPIDVLVMNAAVSTYFGPTLGTKPQALDKMLDINLKSTFLFIAEAVPYMRQDAKLLPLGFTSNILIVTSYAGYTPSAPIGFYGVTKTALLGLVKALAPELAQKSIRINGVAPGLIRTNFAKILVDGVEKAQEKGKEPPVKCDLNRVGEPQEIAGVAAFLCGADASFVTGEVIMASGGTMGRL